MNLLYGAGYVGKDPVTGKPKDRDTTQINKFQKLLEYKWESIF